MTLLAQSLKEAHLGKIKVYRHTYEFQYELLNNLWAPPPEQVTFYQEAPKKQRASSPLFSRSGSPPPPTGWSIAFTPTFRKSISNIDKKLQGRVLSAIVDLADKPVLLHGDTKKPLGAELTGLWRYRVGDYRLIYEPNNEKRLVVLLEFAARGGIYE